MQTPRQKAAAQRAARLARWSAALAHVEAQALEIEQHEAMLALGQSVPLAKVCLQLSTHQIKLKVPDASARSGAHHPIKRKT